MSTQTPYLDIEVPEISLPRLVLDRADERGAAIPLMGPADRGSASPLMGPADPATVIALLGPADRGTMISLVGPADPGTATPLMLPIWYGLPQTAGRASRPARPLGGRQAGHAPATGTASSDPRAVRPERRSHDGPLPAR